MAKAQLKALRREFRDAVFTRDENMCIFCRAPAVDAHHITDRNEMPNGGYTVKNGASLCASCHLKAEEYHMTPHAKCWPGYHPDDLYMKIGSSYEEAYAAASGLKDEG